MNVDKSGFLPGRESETALIKATQKRCKKALASGRESCNIGGAILTNIGFLEARFQAGFLFVTSLGFLQTVVNTEMAGLRNRMGHRKSVS